jgi:hypothetical protein
MTRLIVNGSGKAIIVNGSGNNTRMQYIDIAAGTDIDIAAGTFGISETIDPSGRIVTADAPWYMH